MFRRYCDFYNSHRNVTRQRELSFVTQIQVENALEMVVSEFEIISRDKYIKYSTKIAYCLHFIRRKWLAPK